MHPKAQEIIERLLVQPADGARPGEPEVTRSGPNYLIFFTPRSGSSWLTEFLRSSKGMGNPGEWFNPNFIPVNAKRIGARYVDEYVSAISHIRRDRHTHVFGAEITLPQLDVINDMVNIFEHFPIRGTHFFYLRRADIVRQAISLYRATSTGEFHSTNLDEAGRRTAAYNAVSIERMLRQILKQELGFADMFSRYGITPLALTYERMWEAGPEAILDFFTAPVLGDHSGGKPGRAMQHTKLDNPEVADWPERFRRDCPALMAEVEHIRPAVASDL